MALSGSFSKMPSSYLGLNCTWSAVQSISGNYSDVTVKMYLKYNALYVGTRDDAKISINGESETFSTSAISESSSSAHTKLLKTKTVRVKHDTNGKKSNVKLSASWRFDGSYAGVSIGTITATAEVDLNSIDRTRPTVTFKVSNVTANSFTISAVASTTCDAWKYKSNGSDWITFSSEVGTSQSKTFTNLTPNKEYIMQVCARKKTNQLHGYASEQTVKTLGGATLSSVSTIIADNPTATIKFSATVHDASYKYTLKIKNGTTEYLSISNISLTKGTASKTVTLTSSQRSTLLSKMTSIKAFNATIELLTYSGSTKIGETSSKKVSVQTTSDNSAPDISGFICTDENDTTVEITGNNSYFIQGYSKIKVTPQIATAKNGATIKSYSATCEGITKSNTTGSALSLGAINKSGTITVSLKVTDSRGYTVNVGKTITVVAYAKPKVTSITLRRTNEIEAEIGLNLSGSFSSVIISHVTKNSLRYISWRYKKTNADTYSSFKHLLETSTVDGTKFSFSSNSLYELDVQSTFDFQLRVMDQLTYVDYDFIIPQGTPLVSLRGKKVGINNPNPTVALDVKGRAKVDGGEVWHGGNLQIQVGRYNFENVEANVAQTKDITFDVPFDVTPTITCSAYSIVPERCNVGVSSATKTGFKLSFTRTTAVSTGVFWQAIAIV